MQLPKAGVQKGLWDGQRTWNRILGAVALEGKLRRAMKSTKRMAIIREMKPEDSEEISHLHGLIATEPIDAEFTGLLGAPIIDGDSVCFVAEFEGRIVGFIIGRLLSLSFKQDKSGWIAAIGVDPRFIEHDIGMALTAEILKYYERQGIRAVHASVKWNSVDRLSLLRALGFERSDFINLTKKLH